MVIEYYSLRKSQLHPTDWKFFKDFCKEYLYDTISYIQTGKSINMYYIRVVGNPSTYKKILNSGTKFDYLPNGVNNKKINWNNIKVRV